MKKKYYSIKDVRKMTESVTQEEDDSVMTDIYGNEIDIIKATEEADSDAEKLKSGHVHFRWARKEIERAKRIAAKKGLPYQTYIKSVLKQAMDKEEIA